MLEKLSNKRSILIIGAVFTVLVLGTVVGVVLLNKGKVTPTTKSAEEIFKNILEANSKFESAQKASGLSAVNSEVAIADMKMIAPYRPTGDEPNYYMSQIQKEAGPKYKECESYMYFYDDKVTEESYSFYGEDKYLSKFLTKDSEGNIINLFVNDGTSEYQYQGGKYAVRIKNIKAYPALMEGDARLMTTEVSEESAPSVDDVVTTSVVQSPTDYFGADSRVLGEEEIDGKKYYVVEWSYDGYCNDTEKTVKIVSKSWADTTTYITYKTEMYLGSSDESNRIYTEMNKSLSEKKSYDDVKNDFNFDVNVEIKELDASEYEMGSEKYLAEFKKMFEDNDLLFITPSESLKYRLSGYDSSKVSTDQLYSYFKDRNFYCDSELCSKMYEDMNQVYEISDYEKSRILSTYFELSNDTSYSSINITVFNKVIADSEILNYFSGASSKEVSSTININGKAYQAKTYEISYDYGISKSSPGSEGEESPNQGSSENTSVVVDPMPIEYQYKTYLIILSEGGKTYQLTLSGMKDISEIQKVTYSAYDSSTSTGVESIMKLIKDVKFDNRVIAY